MRVLTESNGLRLFWFGLGVVLLAIVMTLWKSL